MWEVIAGSLLIHLGKKAVDSLWGSNRSGEQIIINNSGIIGQTYYDGEGRTQVSQDVTLLARQPFGKFIGDIYLPDTLEDWMIEQGILLVLILDETSGQVYFFEADLEYGYEIDLPYGTYSCFLFLMDSYEDEFYEAEIFAIGFFCREDIDLTQFGSIELYNESDIWEVVDESPVIVNSSGPFYESFILINTDVEESLPKTFAELIARYN